MSKQKPQTMFLPAGSRRITLADVKRWMAMEARLDLLIEAHGKGKPQGELAHKIQDVLMSTLQFVKDGKE